MAADDVLRSRDADPGVTNMELFFDLVYVFAITQLSHTLLHNLTGRGALETLVLFAAVWWAWNYTAWATNWIDPDRAPVRALMVVLMLLSLLMSAAIPDAFAGRGLLFAASYVALQVVRSAFMVVAFRGQLMGRNYLQLTAWTVLGGLVWIAGGIADGDARLGLWIAAVLVDYAAPLLGYYVPGRGRTPMTAWSLSPGHLAERCQLVVIIALGESVLITGTGVSELELTARTVAAFVVAFLGSVALWWLYFARHAAAAVERVAHSGDPARLGRGGYAYAHAIMVAGVIVSAVGDELVIAHPTGSTSTATALAVLVGAALFIAGLVIFTLSTDGVDRYERAVSIAALPVLVALGALSAVTAPLVLVALTTLMLFGLVAAAAWHARTVPAG